jgi:hypothetical protein
MREVVENNSHLKLDPENIHQVHMKMKMMKEVIDEISHMNNHLNIYIDFSIQSSIVLLPLFEF